MVAFRAAVAVGIPIIRRCGTTANPRQMGGRHHRHDQLSCPKLRDKGLSADDCWKEAQRGLCRGPIRPSMSKASIAAHKATLMIAASATTAFGPVRPGYVEGIANRAPTSAPNSWAALIGCLALPASRRASLSCAPSDWICQPNEAHDPASEVAMNAVVVRGVPSAPRCTTAGRSRADRLGRGADLVRRHRHNTTVPSIACRTWRQPDAMWSAGPADGQDQTGYCTCVCVAGRAGRRHPHPWPVASRCAARRAEGARAKPSHPDPCRPESACRCGGAQIEDAGPEEQVKRIRLEGYSSGRFISSTGAAAPFVKLPVQWL